MTPKRNIRYINGANFERKVKEHLDNELKKQTKGTPIKYYIIRAAGSRGSLDLTVVLTDTSTGIQRVLGFQCKLQRPSYDQMDKFCSQVKHETGIEVFYAYKENRDIVFYPQPYTKWFKVTRGVA